MFLKNLTNKYNLTQILLLVIALLIPLEKTSMRIAIVVVSLVSIFNGEYKVFFKRTSWIKLIPTILWVLPFLQLLFLNKLNIHWAHLETKLSLLIFPVIIVLGFKLNKDFIYEIIRVFIIGCCFSIIICLIHSSYDFIVFKKSNYFFYKKLSFLHHPSYYSMYLNLAIGLLYLNIISLNTKFKINKKWSWRLIISFTIFVILISSRTGWITNFIINSLFIIILMKMKFFNRKHLIIGFAILLSLGGLVNTSTSIKNRYTEIIKHTLYAKEQSNYPSSTNTRIKAWKSATELVLKKWILGTGTGESKVELNKIYDLKGFTQLKKKNTNTHNQFLQYLLDHGVIGFIFLIFFTIILLILSLREKDYMYALFIFIMTINFMTESILETQSGIVFFALFNTLFFFNWIDRKRAFH